MVTLEGVGGRTDRNIQNRPTRAVLKHYEFVPESFFVFELNQIVECMSKGLGLSGSPRLSGFPIYVPVTLSLLLELESRTGQILELPRIHVKCKSRLLVLSHDTIKGPLSSIDDCLDVIKVLKIVNLVQKDEHVIEWDILRKIFRLVALVYINAKQQV
jgi:hypothetical protein